LGPLCQLCSIKKPIPRGEKKGKDKERKEVEKLGYKKF
jgi:hypothetical protein